MDDVVRLLEQKANADDTRRDVTDYLMKLYLVVERVYDVLDIMGLIGVHHPKDGRIPFEFRKSTPGMCAMRDVKQWANFTKHPGAFLWCHNPSYHCESIDSPYLDHADFVFDQRAVDTYYKNDKKLHRELYSLVAGKTGVLVLFPSLETLTLNFCNGVRDFVDTATSPLFLSCLQNRSTYENYYESLESDDWDESSDSEDSDDYFDG